MYETGASSLCSRRRVDRVWMGELYKVHNTYVNRLQPTRTNGARCHYFPFVSRSPRGSAGPKPRATLEISFRRHKIGAAAASARASERRRTSALYTVVDEGVPRSQFRNTMLQQHCAAPLIKLATRWVSEGGGRGSRGPPSVPAHLRGGR